MIRSNGFGYVKVEGTSFTVSEPLHHLKLNRYFYTYATEEQRNILRSQYDVVPFMINTIRLERIFADKIFAAEFYYERKMYFDVAKHLYDVSVMFDLKADSGNDSKSADIPLRCWDIKGWKRPEEQAVIWRKEVF